MNNLSIKRDMQKHFINVIILVGFKHMSPGRIRWTDDFLTLMTASLACRNIMKVCIDFLDTDMTELQVGDIVIGHEIPASVSRRFSRRGVKYIDIRVSPVRFCSVDNLLAISSNDIEIRRALLGYSIPDYELLMEARSLRLSFRYRDLGQLELKANSLVVFVEKPVDNDSIHFRNPVSLVNFVTDLRNLCGRYQRLYYVSECDDGAEEPRLLRDIGAQRCTANIYSIFSSSDVAAIAAIRSGVLEEARYFDMPAVALGETTTPLASDFTTAGEEKFVNVLPSQAMSPAFWDHVVNGTARAKSAELVGRLPHHNLLRRALNNWNSSAAGLDQGGQWWQELVRLPVQNAIRRVQDEVEFRENHGSLAIDDPARQLAGQWRWFTGEIVQIELSGHVRSELDFGRIVRSGKEIALHWCRRMLTDDLVVAPGQRSFQTKNQYGDGGVVHRIDDDGAIDCKAVEPKVGQSPEAFPVRQAGLPQT